MKTFLTAAGEAVVLAALFGVLFFYLIAFGA